MKAKIALLVFLLSGLFRAQQNQFIIGVDWLNSNHNYDIGQHTQMSSAYWSLIKDLKLNFGTLNFDVINGSSEITNIQKELDNANIHGLQIELNTGDWPFHVYAGRRWIFQVEEDYDFTSHQTGSNYSTNDNTAELHWSLVNNNNGDTNCYRLSTQSGHQPGFAASGISHFTEIPDGINYYAKIRMRKMTNISDTTKIIAVIITNLAENKADTCIMRANDTIGYNTWKDMFLFSFNKTALGPDEKVLPDTTRNIISNDYLGICGVKDYLVQTNGYTQYDIRVYWYGQVNCDLDYIAIDDYFSDQLHRGIYDDNIRHTVIDNFPPSSYPALYSFKLWDEPDSMNYLPVRYVNNKIIPSFSNGGSAYNNGHLAQKYLAQTGLKIHRCDIYPCGINSTPPGNSNYTSDFQNLIQEHFVSYLSEEISIANRFTVPYWLGTQAHSWKYLNDPYHGQREPSAYRKQNYP